MTPAPAPPALSPVRRFASRAGSRLVIGFFAIALAAGTPSALADVLHWPDLVGALVSVATSLLAYLGFVRFFERRPVPELAPTRLVEVLPGVALGTALFSATIGIIWLAGGYHVDGRGGLAPIAAALAIALASAVGEELIFRGVVFRISEELLGTTGALALSAAIFGGLHFLNPNGTVAAAAAVALEAGVLLGAAYLVNRRLWLPIGVHAGWNFTQGGVFGVAISGHDVHGWLNGKLEGAAWLTGDKFGAEASVPAVAVCVAAAVVMVVVAWKRGQWRKRGGSPHPG